MIVLSPAGGLTLGVGGAADDVGQFGLQAGVGGAVPARRLVAARAQRQHALQRRVGPQTLALVDGQRRGVVDEESSVLNEEEAEVNVDQGRLFSSQSRCTNVTFFFLRPGGQCLFSAARTSRRCAAAERLPGWRAAVLAGSRRFAQE